MDLRAGLRSPLGILLLLLSCLLAAVLAWLPQVADRSDRAPLLLGLGVLGYLASTLIVAWPAGESRHPAVLRMLDVYRSMAARLAELQANTAVSQSALVPIVAEALDHMSRHLLPTLREIVARHETLSRHLADYEVGKLPSPDPAISERLQRIHARQQEAIDTCVQQAANAYATLLALMQEADEAIVAQNARMWATDLLDIYDSLSGLLSGIDPYEQAMQRLRIDPSATERVLPAIEDAVSQIEPGDADQPAAARLRVPGRTTKAIYPDGLTEREVEVLMLVAEGYTSGEVAAELVLTVATVSRHIANIYNKINARGRAEATRYAIKHGLIGETDGEGTILDLQPAARKRSRRG